MSFDAEAWEGLRGGATCPACAPPDADSAARLVAELPSGRAVLQDDADFPGYCILYLRRHAVELTELSPAERAAFMEDLARIAAAVQAISCPAKLNYAILGNVVPHLHAHVIPRFPADGWWGSPIWLRPESARRPLAPERRTALLTQLRGQLG